MRRELSWKELTDKAWGSELTAPDVAYEFSGGRKFYDHHPVVVALAAPPVIGTVTGFMLATNRPDTLVASGSPVVSGTLAKTNANDTASSSSTVGQPIGLLLLLTKAT